MKVNKTLKLLASVTLIAAALPAQADGPNGRDRDGRNMRGSAPIAQPVFRNTAPVTLERPRSYERDRFERPYAVQRPIYAPPPVIVQRPVVVTRPVYVERPVYMPAPVYYPAPAPAYYPEPVAYPESAPAYYPEPAPVYYPERDVRANVPGAVGGAVIGGVIGSAVGHGDARRFDRQRTLGRLLEEQRGSFGCPFVIVTHRALMQATNHHCRSRAGGNP
jgi:hypothetical protein